LLDLSKQTVPMVRYLKVNLVGPELSEGLYCTLTNLKVYGRTMHAVMKDSLMDLVKPTLDMPAHMVSDFQTEETHSDYQPKRSSKQFSSPSTLTSSLAAGELHPHSTEEDETKLDLNFKA
jgi:hypothetical protein